MMVKILETQARLFHNVFVCKKCKTKRKASMMKIMEGRIKCRRCNGKAFRPIKKSKVK